MGELLLRKAILCRDRIARIRAALPSDPSSVLRDERLESFLAFQFFLLLQDLLDVAAHLVAARGLAVPGSQRELFAALVAANLLDEASGREMGALASLRNRIAHTYGDLDPVRLVREMPDGLAAVERFLARLAEAVGEP